MNAKDREEREEESVENYAERLTKETKDKVKAADEQPDEPEEEPEPAVEVEDDDSDEERVTRRERRQARVKEFESRAERAEREASELRAQQNQLMQQLIALQQPKEQPVDYERQLDEQYESTEMELIRLRGVYSQRAQQYQQAGQEMPEAELRHFIRQQQQLELKKHSIIGDAYIRRNGYAAPDPRQQQAQMEVAALRAQHADVFANQAAALHVDYAFKRLRAEGKPDTLETAQAAVAEARRVILKQGPAGGKPTQAQKSKYTGSASGAGGQAGREPVPVIKLSEQGKKMADAALGHIKDEKKRYETWGKRMWEADKARKSASPKS